MTTRAIAAPLAASLAAIAVATTIATTEGFAADLGQPGGRRVSSQGPMYEAPVSIERWTGFYFGATLGYASGTIDISGGSGHFSVDNDGTVGTLLAGYNMQSGRMLFGVEADIGTGDQGGRGWTAASGVRSDVNVFGSLRGRFGMLMSPALLAYATGGLAWADMDMKVTGFGKTDETFWGYQLGAGAEYMVAPNWTLRLEYVYTDLAAQTITTGGVSNRFDPDTHTVRAGVAFRF